MKNKILIVDDDKVNILILEEILGKEYLLEQAYSGDDALKYAKSFKPDLVILDIMMPGLNGYEVCKKIKSGTELRFTKIILVSAKTMLSERLKGYESGADDYITKPFDPEELLAKVKVFLRLKSAEEIERVKDNLLSVFSHETRTPIDAVIGFARLLSESPNLSENEKESVQHILNSGFSLMELVNKTIFLSNLKKGKIEIHRTKTRLWKFVSEVANEFLEEMHRKKIVFSIHPPPSDISIKLDQALFKTCIMYLMNNAIKFTPDNGKIDIEIIPDKNNALIKVRDTGSGIDGDDTELIFSELHADDIEHHGRGHKMSLSIVKYIVEMHDGSVSAVNNSDGKGCTFSISLPLK